MALNIKNPQTERLIRELAAETGESITTTVEVSVRERLERLGRAAPREHTRRELTKIATRSAKRRRQDTRSPDEILGYHSQGH